MKRESSGKVVSENPHSSHFLFTEAMESWQVSAWSAKTGRRHPCNQVAPLPLLKRGKKSLQILNTTNQTSMFGSREYLEFYNGLRASF